MKKLIAISLLALHLFNLAGYGLVTDYFIHRSDARVISHLDHETYDQSRLVEVKIPINMPYLQGSLQYERFDGTLEHEGVQYNYVKRRLYNDTLTVLCLPNDQKTAIVKDSRHLANELNDLPLQKKGKQTNLKKSATSADYFSCPAEYSFLRPFTFAVMEPVSNAQPLLRAFRALPERPPCFIA